MKPSPYNHFVELKGEAAVLLYNALTGALAQIEQENYQRVLYLIEHPDAAKSPQDDEFLTCLREGGFLIPDAIDQTGMIKMKARSIRLENLVLALTIAPTLACNFDCHYCYESRSSVVMSEETQQALVRFADYHLRKADALRVCWFGGEPTLCFPLIERVQTRLLETAARHRVDLMPGMIISNGYLLDLAMAQRLAQLGVTQAQITIDGPKETHDSRRKLRNGRGSFDRIIENLSAIAGIMDVTVRVNIDRDNTVSACEVVSVLADRGILPKVAVNFAQVVSMGEACANIRDRCYDAAQFAEALVGIHSQLIRSGKSLVRFPRVGSALPCGAVAEGNFVVSPTGHLFRCWEDLSTDARRSVGHLRQMQPDAMQAETLSRYRDWDPFKLPECASCNVLPICLGGCPLAGLQAPESRCGECSHWKYSLGDLLELVYSAQSQRARQT